MITNQRATKTALVDEITTKLGDKATGLNITAAVDKLAHERTGLGKKGDGAIYWIDCPDDEFYAAAKA